MGIAPSVVSLFYNMRPLYDGVGGTVMWAVMNVGVVFEYTIGVIPLITFAFLLIEISACIEAIVDAVQELANKADFKIALDDKPKQNEHKDKNVSEQFKEVKTMKTRERI
ncbi:hypothetical protein ACH5RR_041806 [Cinchona calisaya]|uniref:Uncharacterized protein n=1 Tax=Cinchona calisaya TaxID=153742 RepID=A0ABD2XXX9_9GENT